MSQLDDAVKGLSFEEKLIYVVENGILDYWVDRNDPPNVDKLRFLDVMKRLTTVSNYHQRARESDNGPYAANAEDQCFKFNCVVDFYHHVKKKLVKEEKEYFVKGYFFDKGNLRGVVIQTCREER